VGPRGGLDMEDSSEVREDKCFTVSNPNVYCTLYAILDSRSLS
jgi:hypothetical protein